MTLLQHFRELRRRVGWCLLVFVIALIVGFYFAPDMQRILTGPLLSVFPGGQMLYTGLTDGFMIEFNLGILVALVVTVPVILWHLWAFVSPGLHANEKKFFAPIMIISPTLFAAGAAFAYFVMFPMVFGFFVRMNQSAPVPAIFLPNYQDYLAFAIGMLKVFGIAFQLPLVLVILNRAGILSRAAVVKFRRFAIVGIFIVAAIMTPGPDMVSQICLALPLVALFELGVMFMKKS